MQWKLHSFQALALGLTILLVAGCGGGTPTPLPPSPTPQPAAIAEVSPTPFTMPTQETPEDATLASTSLFPTAPPPSPTPRPTDPPTRTPAPTATATIPPAVIELEGATLPPGFSITLAISVTQPTGLAFDSAGDLFVTAGDGAIHVFSDADGDGSRETETLFAEGFTFLQGLAFHPDTGEAYVSSQGRIDVLTDEDGDRQADAQRTLVEGLPYDWHWNNNPTFGPDGMLYVGVGSTCDVCEEEDPRSATVMRFDPDTGADEIIASGLRNPFDLAFHPDTGALFATDNGRDDLGEFDPPEELNLILEGADYGFPDCWGDNSQEGCQGVQQAVAFFQARSSVNSIDFYTSDRFPPEFRSSEEAAVLYATVFGAWDFELPVGIQRVILRPAGDSYAAEVDWFAQWAGNPLGLVMGPDGALYVGDYALGAIYRISYGP